MKLHRLATVTAVTLLTAGGLAACGSSSDEASPGGGSTTTPTSAAASPSPSASASASDSPSASPTAAAAMITIKDYKYAGTTKVAPGTKVTVKNLDSEAHTVTTDSGSAINVNVLPGKTATFTAPSKAGAYKYHCTYHSNMHGSLAVG